MAAKPPHEIARLMPRHFQIIDLCLAGHGVKEIAQAVGLTPQAVSLITNATNFQAELARRREGINAKTDDLLATGVSRAKSLLDANAEAAVQVHVDLLDENRCPDPRVRQNSASKILDLVMGQEQKHASQVVVLEAGAIQLLQIALMESSGETLAVPSE